LQPQSLELGLGVLLATEEFDSELITGEAYGISRHGTDHAGSETTEETTDTTLSKEGLVASEHIRVLAVHDEIISLHSRLDAVQRIDHGPIEKATDCAGDHELPGLESALLVLVTCGKVLLGELVETEVLGDSNSVTEDGGGETLHGTADAVGLQDRGKAAEEGGVVGLGLENLSLELGLEEINRAFDKCNKSTSESTSSEETGSGNLTILVLHKLLGITPHAELPSIQKHLTVQRGSNTLVEATETFRSIGLTDAVAKAGVDRVSCGLSLETDLEYESIMVRNK